MARGKVLSGTEMAVTAHMAGLRRRACGRGEAEGIGSGEDEGDLVVKSRKFRDLTVMHL
jgi:hypothetical protein